MFWLRNKKIKFSLHTLNLSPDFGIEFQQVFICKQCLLSSADNFLFDLILYVLVNNFSGLPGLNQY